MDETEMTFDQLWYTDRDIPYSLIMRANGTAACIDEIKEPVLDIGEDNPFKKILEVKFNLKIESTDASIDFDRDKIIGKYGTIFCFEVLEHLYNPLFHLDCLKKALKKDGAIYLSTPRNGCTKLRWYYRHFNEIPDKQIGWLFNKAGLIIEKKTIVPFHEHWWQLWNGGIGLRPILKYINKTRVFKLKVK